MTALQRSAVCCLAAVPLVVDPAGHNRYGPLRWFVAVGLITVLLIDAARRGNLRVDRNAGAAWLVFLGVAVIATFGARDPVLALWGDPVRLGGLTSYFLLFAAFAAGCATGAGALRFVGLVVVASGTLAAAIGVTRYALAAIDGRTGRAIGWSGNAAYLGALLALALPIAIALLVSAKGRDRRLMAAIPVMVLALALTGTRGAWVGAAAGTALLLVAATSGRVRWVAPALVVVVLVLGLLVPLGTRAPGNLDLSSGTARGRVDTWVIAMRAVNDRPALGWGPDGGRVALEEHVDRQWVRRYGLERLPDRGHNALADTALATGSMGLLAWLAIVVAVVAGCRRHHLTSADGAERWLALGMTGGLVAYGVQALFFFETFDTGIVAWFVAGAVIANAHSRPWSVPRRSGTVAVAAVMGALLAFGVIGLAADRRARSALRRDDPKATVDGLASAARLRPRSLDVLLIAAARAGSDRAALRAAHDLIGASQDPDVVLADADVLVGLARAGEPARLVQATRRYEAVLRRQPHNGLAWLGHGEALAFAGDQSGARASFVKAHGLLPRSPYPALDLGLLDLAAGDPVGACRWAAAAGRVPAADRLAEDLRARIRGRANRSCP